MSATPGISTLLEAEKEAAKIVAKAKAYRTQRLKDARTEATKEIEGLKAAKAAEFQHFEKTHGASQDIFANVDAETAAKIKEIQASFSTNKQSVVDKLITNVTRVTPHPHVNSLL